MRISSFARHAAVLVVLFAGTLAARAVTITFDFTPANNSGLGFSFSLDSHDSSLLFQDNAYAYGAVPITLSNGFQYSSIVFFWEAGAPLASIQDETLSIQNPTLPGMNIDYTGLQLFTDGINGPSFLDGTYNVGGTSTPGGTLTISSTPEPSSLILLGTGGITAIAAARRKIIGRV